MDEYEAWVDEHLGAQVRYLVALEPTVAVHYRSAFGGDPVGLDWLRVAGGASPGSAPRADPAADPAVDQPVTVDAASVVSDLDGEAQEILQRFSAEDQQRIVDLVREFTEAALAPADA